MVRVAVVLPRGAVFDPERPTSIETVVRTLAQHSRDRDRMVVFCDGGARTPSAFDLRRLPSGLSRSVRVDALADLLHRLKPDVVEHHQSLGPAAELARRLPGVPHIFYRHTEIGPGRHPLAHWRRARRLARFDRLVFVSGWARAEFGADFPALAPRATAVPNAIDITAWRGDPDARDKLILFSGRATPDKGLDLFCTALASTLDRRPDWRGALMVGEWERSRDWAEPVVGMLARFGDRVEIHRSASPACVRATIQRAAIAVIPSRAPETLGLAALEAHAAGAALVSSGLGGLREASGEHAIYVPSAHPDDYAAAINWLIDHAAERVAMTRAAQARVERAYCPLARAHDLDALRASVARAPAGLAIRTPAFNFPRLRPAYRESL